MNPEVKICALCELDATFGIPPEKYDEIAHRVMWPPKWCAKCRMIVKRWA